MKENRKVKDWEEKVQRAATRIAYGLPYQFDVLVLLHSSLEMGWATRMRGAVSPAHPCARQQTVGTTSVHKLAAPALKAT